jgi:RTX calcium-binding nonapeptide repeat (4 copies)
MRLFQHDRHQDVGQRARGIRRFAAGVEGLEGRRLLNGSGATILLTGSTIEIIGTNLGDTGRVTIQNGAVDVKISNSQGSDDDQFPVAQVGSIVYLGGSGNNTFTNDTPLNADLYGGAGNNTLTGGSGVDLLVATSGGVNVLNAGSGFEVLEATGTGTNTLNGGSGYDEMLAFAGNNQFNDGSGYDFIIAVGGQNVINAGTGYATVYSFSSTDVINANGQMTVYHFGY